MESVDTPFLINSDPQLILDAEMEDMESTKLQLHTVPDYYDEKFYNQEHFNFVVKKPGNRNSIVSVLTQPNQILMCSHDCLETTETGSREFNISVFENNKISLESSILASLVNEKSLNSLTPSTEPTIIPIRGKEFNDLLRSMFYLLFNIYYSLSIVDKTD